MELGCSAHLQTLQKEKGQGAGSELVQQVQEGKVGKQAPWLDRRR